MSELIWKDDGTPFATEMSAKAAKTRMGRQGLDVNIVSVDGGSSKKNKEYKKPKKRIPIGTRNVLTIPKGDKDPRYSYRIVNDEPDRIRMFRDAGWEVVERRGGLQVGDVDVGDSSQLGSLVTKTVGKNKIGYLMRIKKEFYDEDQEAKAEKIRQGESALKQETQKKGRYGKIKIGDRPEY